MPPIRYPEDLPISQRREEILAAVRAHQVVIVAGETGSGKTTQLPKMCLDAGLAERGRIGCTQPRRVAALSVSRRVAEELGVVWGREVGCKMRFNDDTGRDTRIKFMTDGILLAEIQSDPLLRTYSTLIIDEAHERSLNIDFLLGYLQDLLRKRADLKVLITSATIDTLAFSEAFGGAPIIEVSGRLWPVEIRYAPAHSFSGEESDDELSHIESAVRATEDAFLESDAGDVLIFMPTERDIRETRELLEGTLGSGFDVIGLFGRMPAQEQQRIFSPGPRRRVIVATNIAETSITLPRIRYVIDAGLSRVSRYNPRTRTKRLPVEAISQSSANQRAGRAGRLQDGICIRLYAEDDYEKRPRFTQPEIQRANLAEVILRMKAFRLGDIATFPFLNPPQTAAINAGYALLHELGALNDTNDLTPLGAELARLPIDPTLGRMLLQAREEGALPEVLVIAAGLSVPDPRERPEEQKEAAAAAHRKFADPASDFLGLLNIWQAAPEAEGRGGANALRRFAKANFLSSSRLREWRDVHRQLADAVGDAPRSVAPNAGTPRPVALGHPASPRDEEPAAATYSAIHRSVLAGLLGQIALREKPNGYKASGNRLVTIFPGSHLYERREKPVKKGGPPKDQKAPEKSRQPLWIMAGEIVETSMLFARTVAGIDPEWVIALAPHLTQYRYTEPHWSAKAGRVLVLERVLVHGLELARRHVDHGRINPVEATELFLRGALVAEEARLPLRFFEENRRLRDKLETALTRVRNRWAHSLDESLYQFYAARLEGISSVHDLNRAVRARLGKEPDFLCATEEDLIGGHDASFDRDLFPDQVSMGNSALVLSYAYNPGDEADGVTVRVPLPVAEQLTTGQLQWMVPGLREEQIGVLLRALPKTVRKTLHPLQPKIAEVTAEFEPGREDFLPALAAFLTQRYRVAVQASDWPPQSLPAHLQTRIEVVDGGNKTVVTGRDLGAIQAVVEKRDVRSGAWERATQRWERYALSAWSFGDLPESIIVEEIGGAPVLAYPSLERDETGVNVRLFRKPEEATTAAPAAIRRLGELALAREFARVAKDLAALARQIDGPGARPASFHAALAVAGARLQSAPAVRSSPELLQEGASASLVKHSFVLDPVFPLTAARFEAMIDGARKELPARTYQIGEWAKQILTARQRVAASSKRYAGLERDLDRLVPPDFLARTPYPQLPHVVRYLRAIEVRAERAALNPGKDAEKAKPLAAFIDWEKRVPVRNRETFRWMLEEFRVSLFAQELGTAHPVSLLRLKALQEPEEAGAAR